MSRCAEQLTLFEMPRLERDLPDDLRTLLEAIDRHGAIKPRTASRIAYELRNWRLPRDPAWGKSCGYRLLRQLERYGFVEQRRDGLWERATLDLIGPEALASGPSLSTPGTVPANGRGTVA